MTDERFTREVTASHGSRLLLNRAANGEVWFYGTVVTPLGYVHVHSEPSFTSLSTMRNGVEINQFMRGKSFSKRGLVTVARRFIEGLQ